MFSTPHAASEGRSLLLVALREEDAAFWLFRFSLPMPISCHARGTRHATISPRCRAAPKRALDFDEIRRRQARRRAAGSEVYTDAMTISFLPGIIPFMLDTRLR